MSKHFCCCIPVRVAVFIFSFLSFLGAGFAAGVGWYLVYLIDTDKIDKLDNTNNVNIQWDDKQRAAFEQWAHKYKWGFIVGSIVFTIISLMALFGFIGSIIRNRRMVKAYSYMTILIFILGSVISGFSLYITWSNKPFCATIDGVETCLTSALNHSSKIGYTIAVIIQWLIDLYIVVIIRRYYTQLEEEREYRHDFRLNPTTAGTYEAKEGLLTQGHYPYADNQHSFGAHNA